MNKITIDIFPTSKEPKYYICIQVSGKTYEIRNVLKSLGFKWESGLWRRYVNPFKEDVRKVIDEIKNELSKHVEVKLFSAYFIDKSVSEGIKEMIKDCEKWKQDYDKVRENFINVLKKFGFTSTIKEFEKGTIEVSIITVKTRVNDEVIVVPRFIEILNRIENFKEVFNELRKLNYRYSSILRAFEIRASKIVK